MADQNTGENQVRKSRLDIEQTIAVLNKIAKEISSDKINDKDFVFAMKKIEMSDDLKDKALEMFDNIKQKYGLSVNIIENMDVKNVTHEKRYVIRISDINRNYVEIDLMKYREDSSDFGFNQVQFFADKLIRLLGALTEELDECAVDIANYIAYIINVKEMYTLLYKTIGWTSINNEVVFKYDTLLSNNKYMSGEFDDDIRDSLEPKGDEEYWLTKAQILFMSNEHVKGALILCAAVSGVVRQLITYTKETNINMNIVGDRASGKSTLQHFILSFFGNPAEIEGSFIDTVNAAEINRIKLSVIPYMLDERLLRYEDNSDKRKKVEVIMDIFREYEGKGKERLGGQYKELSGQRTCGAIISSSVERIMDLIYDYGDLGQFRRFIEITVNDTETFDNAESAEEYETISKLCYGLGIRKFVTYLLESGLYNTDKIDERFGKAKRKVNSILETYDFYEYYDDMKSSVSRFALIYLTGELINEAFGWDMDLEAIVQILKENLVEKLKVVETKQKRVSISSNDAVADFVRFLISEKDYFTSDKSEFISNTDKYIGYTEAPNQDTLKVHFVSKKERNCRDLCVCGVPAEKQLVDGSGADENKAKAFFRMYNAYFEAVEDRDRVIEGKKQVSTKLVIIHKDTLRADGYLKKEGESN